VLLLLLVVSKWLFYGEKEIYVYCGRLIWRLMTASCLLGHIQETSTSGVLAGYKGKFNSYGLVDLENLQGLIRYSGTICK